MELREALGRIGKRRTLVTFHSLGDVDAVCSALALAELLPDSYVAAPDRVGASAKKLLDALKIKIPLYSETEGAGGKAEAIVVVDANSQILLPHLAGKKIDLIVDHHNRHGDALSAEMEIIEPRASSACEVIYGQLKLAGEKRLRRKGRLALYLLCGVISDSALFRSASEKTFAMVAELLPYSALSYQQTVSLLAVPPDISQRLAVFRACTNGKLAYEHKGHWLVASAMAESFEAHVAQTLMEAGADAAVVGFKAEGTVRISARLNESLKETVDLVKIMAETGRLIGGTGGGHPGAAGANGTKGEKLEEAVEFAREKISSALEEDEGQERKTRKKRLSTQG